MLGEKIPKVTLVSLNQYAEHHIKPGRFLEAVLSNDLMTTMGRADKENREAMRDICEYIFTKLPFDCWGSETKMRNWLARNN